MRCLVLALAGLAVAGLPMAVPAARADPAAIIPDVDQLIVYKHARRLVLLAHGQAVYTIAGLQLGPEPAGPKHFQGDGRTPEGHYRIDYGNPNSAYEFALHISYPSAADADFARAQGRAAGGDIFIHGQPQDWSQPGRVPGDWTAGCIAVSDAQIETLWQSVPDGTPIDILP